MATLVNKIKDKVSHRRSGSSASHEASRPATQAGPSSVAQDDVPQQMTPPRGPTYVSLENSAFHIHKGPNNRASMEDDEGHYYDAQSSPTRAARDADAHATDVIPDRASSKRGTTTTSPTHTTTTTTTTTLHSGAQRSAHARNVSAGQSSSSGMPRASLDNPTVRLLNGVNSRQPGQEVPESILPGRASSRHADTVGSEMQTPPRRQVANGTSNSADDERALPALPQNTSATGTAQHVAPLSPTNANAQQVPRDAYRRDSVSRKPLPGTPKHSYAANKENADPMPNEDLNLSAGLANMYLQQPKSRDTAEFAAKQKALDAGHIRLPEGFNIGDSVRTHVMEEQRPAVTHETIVNQRTEVFHEAITRDIHIHHYYTYLQPVKVTEVLPARHFELDPITGIKKEIAEPPGWQMPLTMLPTRPDASMLKGSTRHYLVDEEHPRGVPEAPPLKHEHGRENLRAQAIV